MAFFGVQFPSHELGIVFLQIPYPRFLEQGIAVVHLHTQGVERVDNFLGIRDDCFLGARKLCKEMSFNLVEQGQFHFLGIHQDKLQLRGVLLVDQRGQNHVEAY